MKSIVATILTTLNIISYFFFSVNFTKHMFSLARINHFILGT